MSSTSHFCKVLVYASFSAPTTAGQSIPANSVIPFNNTVFAKNSSVFSPFGIFIGETGTYGITFNVILASAPTTTVTFNIFTNKQLIATVSVPPGSTTAKVAAIARLHRKDVLQVLTTTGAVVFDANLTAAKIG